MTVTIGLPFSEQDAFFEDTLKSIFLQSSQDWRLLLVGDAPSQRCLDIAQQAARDDRVDLVVDGTERRGLAARLNQIADLATTDYLFRMDADDIMVAGRIEAQQRALSEGGYDLVASYAHAIDLRGNLIGDLEEAPLPPRPIRTLRSHLLTHPTVAGRTQWFLDNPYDPSYKRAEDKNLWLRTMNTSSILKMPDRLMFYRLRIPTPLGIKLASSSADRRTVREHGVTVAGRPETYRYLASSYAKDALYLASHTVGRAAWIDRRKVLHRELADANRELKMIQATRLATLIRSRTV